MSWHSRPSAARHLHLLVHLLVHFDCAFYMFLQRFVGGGVLFVKFVITFRAVNFTSPAHSQLTHASASHFGPLRTHPPNEVPWNVLRAPLFHVGAEACF